MTNAPAPKSASKLWTYLIPGIVLLCVAGIVYKSYHLDPPNGYGAEVACESFVKQQLKAPSTASFSSESFLGASPTFTVTGTVDAENSFGARLRMTFTCVVDLDGSTWHLRSLDGLT